MWRIWIWRALRALTAQRALSVLRATLITGPDRSHRLTIDDDIGSTALDGVQRITCASLCGEQLPGRDSLL